MKGAKTGGRQKGSRNKITNTVKKSVLQTFLKLQRSPEYNMYAWAKKNETEFWKIAAKLIPTEITAELTGGNGAPLYKVIAGIDINKITRKKS